MLHYKVIVMLPSPEFQKFCSDLKEFDETMVMNASGEGIRFSVQGDIHTGNVMLKPREIGKPEEKVSISMHVSVTATFVLRYLTYFAKAASLCSIISKRSSRG